jgi:uncharacterized protein (DUF697 family)/tellurite resistance protein
VESSAQEALASLRVLVAMAQADGVLHERERVVLETALSDVELPEGLAPRTLLEETPDLAAAIAALARPDARRSAYSAAFALARADGECAPAEAALLDRLRRELSIEDEEQARLERLFGDLDAGGPTVAAIADPIRRKEACEAETRKCAIISAVLGAFPFPGLAIATDLAVAGLQVGLARDIAALWGHPFERDAAKRLLSAFGLGTGARIAVTNLLKLLPGWGSAAGAAAAYASSWAVGRTVERHFSGGDELDVEALRHAFDEAHKAGKKAYAADASEVEARRRASEGRLQELAQRVQAGEIGGAQLAREVARG